MLLRFTALAVLLSACSLATAPIRPGERDTGVPGLDAPGLDAPSPEMDAPVTPPDVPMPGDDVPATTPDVPAAIDAPMPTPDVPVVGSDSGTGGTVACGTVTCSAPQICCVTTDVDPPTAACVGPGACRGLAVRCDGPEDCSGGNICCGRGMSASDAETVCQPAAGCFIRICHTGGDCGGGMCCPFMGSGYCSPFCG